MHLQLAFNDLSGTSLAQHQLFLDATGDFHEELRMFFYPKIFSGASGDDVNWKQFKPTYFDLERNHNPWELLLPISLALFLMLLACMAKIRQL